MDIKIELSRTEIIDLQNYCKLNNYDISSVIKKSFTTGFRIEKYGLLNSDAPATKEIIKEVPVEVIKEVIREVPIEVVKEVQVEVIKEVIKEVPIETIKEVPVEIIKEVFIDKIVEKDNNDIIFELQKKIENLENIKVDDRQKKQLLALQETVKTLRETVLELTDKLKNCENTKSNQQPGNNVIYLKDSNLGNKLY